MSRWVRLLVLLAPVVLAALLVAPRLPLPAGEGLIFVSPQGSDLNHGRSMDSPVATIQQAADMVEAGQTIIVMPGTYREDVRLRRGGTEGKPVTIKAREPGTVTISGAAPAAVVAGLAWREEGDKIWSAAAPWPVYYVMGDGENFFHVRWADGTGDKVYHWVGTEGRVARLRELTKRSGSWGAFTYEQGRVYVAFKDGLSPQRHDLQFNRPLPRPYASWSLRAANLWVEADHMRIEGIRFHLGAGAGILLWNARDIVVTDCMFTGAVSGISNFPSVARPDGLVVQHSFYNNYPQNEWLKGWVTWDEVYSHHSVGTLLSVAGDGITIRHNLVTHAGDGMQVSTPGPASSSSVQVYGNLLAYGTDDGIELDGHAAQVHIHHNLIYDFYLSLGASPVFSGPVLVRKNLFLHPAQGKVGAHLKFMNPWIERGGPFAGPIRNVMVVDNVFSGKWLTFSKSAYENVHVVRNIFADAIVDERFGLPPGVVAEGNAFVNSPVPSGRPDSACKIKSLAQPREPAASMPAAFDRLSRTPDVAGGAYVERPGPSWLDYEKTPASREVADLARQWLEVAARCD